MRKQVGSIFFIIGSLGMLGLIGCSIPGSYVSPPSKASVKVEKRCLDPKVIILNGRVLETQAIPSYYPVSPHDILDIIIWHHSEESPNMSYNPSQYQASCEQYQPGILVDEQGVIFFPYVGKLRVVGLSVEEIRKLLIQHLTKYIRDPQVTVRVSAFRGQGVYVFGEVNKPGRQPITDKPLTLMAAIAQAEDVVKQTADTGHIYLFRGDYFNPKVYWLNAKSMESFLVAQNFYLQPGDIVYVPAVSLARWNRVVSLILPTVQSIWMSKALTQ